LVPAVHTQQPVTSPVISLPTYQGRIAVAPNGRYFVDAAGQGFIVIGQNDAISWPGLNTLFDGTSPGETEAYIRDLRAHGVTVSRIMIEYAQQPQTYLENPVGTFNEDVIAFWDAFIPMAEAHGLYLLLTPYDTFWQSDRWDTYPYNAAVGGPCAVRRDWLTGRDCIEAQKARWRFIIDRWGGSPSIFAWDLMNEIELWWNNSNEEIAAYVDEMAAFVRDYQMARWGVSPLLTVSSAAATPEGALGRIIFNHPALDFANTHIYTGEIADPNNAIMPGALMGGGVLLALQAIDDARPFFDSESGPISDWIVNPRFDREYHNNMSWAHLASCGAGSGMRWPYTNPHVILPELRDNLLALARFASTFDWANFASENMSQRTLVSDRLILRAGCADGRTGMVWLLADRRNDDTVVIPGVEVTVRDVFEDGDYALEYWDTYTGDILVAEFAQAVDGVLAFTVPDMPHDVPALMVAIRPLP
jgi:mannan endo-1,4-beta-mannosidase